MSQQTIKKHLLAVPFVGRGLRIMSSFIHAPTYWDTSNSRMVELKELLQKSEQNTEQSSKNMLLNHEKLESLLKNQDRFNKELALVERSSELAKKASKSSSTKDKELFADDHLLDVFYTEFEDRFRGTESIILKRLEEYLDDFKNAKVDFNKYPVVDIGSGRGEFLQLLNANSINAKGLDINIDMVERSKQKGLEAEQGDALEYLQAVDSQTLGAITGFHIVEHIPFNVLLRIFKSCHQALVDDGFVLFETPNPENMIVGSCAFYMDPSHLHPLPPDLLAFALETAGFRNVQIRRIHPVEHDEKDDLSLPPEFINRFYGPRDYVVLGYK